MVLCNPYQMYANFSDRKELVYNDIQFKSLKKLQTYL